MIRRAQDGRQQHIRVCADAIEIRLEQVDPFGGAAPHQHRWHRDHFGPATHRIAGSGFTTDIDIPFWTLLGVPG